MTTLRNIASALRQAGLITATANTLSYINFLQGHVDDEGYAKARPLRVTGKGKNAIYHTCGNLMIEAVFNFLGVAYTYGYNDPAPANEFFKYNLAEFYVALKEKTGIDLVEDVLKEVANRKARGLHRNNAERIAEMEAAQIVPDLLFMDDLIVAADLTGQPKQVAHREAFSNLLKRRGFTGADITEFWRVFKLVRDHTEQLFKDGLL